MVNYTLVAMTTIKLLPLAFLIPAFAAADVWITNFETPTAGVWKNSTTATDLTIPVAFTFSNATIAEETVTTDDFPWIDLFYDLFNPNYDGDYIALLVKGGSTATVTISFGTDIVNPVLHFTDTDDQTTLVFSTATPTKVGGAPNLQITGNSVRTDGTSANPFDPTDVETVGSLQFTGTFSELAFTIVNTGADPDIDDDVTGFSVSTTTEPVSVSTPTPTLTIWADGTNYQLSWPDTNTFTHIECSPDLSLGSWMILPGADPTTTTMYSGTISSSDDALFFRGGY